MPDLCFSLRFCTPHSLIIALHDLARFEQSFELMVFQQSASAPATPLRSLARGVSGDRMRTCGYATGGARLALASRTTDVS